MPHCKPTYWAIALLWARPARPAQVCCQRARLFTAQRETVRSLVFVGAASLGGHRRTARHMMSRPAQGAQAYQDIGITPSLRPNGWQWRMLHRIGIVRNASGRTSGSGHPPAALGLLARSLGRAGEWGTDAVQGSVQ